MQRVGTVVKAVLQGGVRQKENCFSVERFFRKNRSIKIFWLFYLFYNLQCWSIFLTIILHEIIVSNNLIQKSPFWSVRLPYFYCVHKSCWEFSKSSEESRRDRGLRKVPHDKSAFLLKECFSREFSYVFLDAFRIKLLYYRTPLNIYFFLLNIVIKNRKIVWKHEPYCWYFRLNLNIHQNSKKWWLFWELLNENDFEAVLTTFRCYDHGANASKAVQKISTDQKEYPRVL